MAPSKICKYYTSYRPAGVTQSDAHTQWSNMPSEDQESWKFKFMDLKVRLNTYMVNISADGPSAEKMLAQAALDSPTGSKPLRPPSFGVEHDSDNEEDFDDVPRRRLSGPRNPSRSRSRSRSLRASDLKSPDQAEVAAEEESEAEAETEEREAVAGEEMARLEAGILRIETEGLKWAMEKEAEETRDVANFGDTLEYRVRFGARAKEQRKWADIWNKSKLVMQRELQKIRRAQAFKDAFYEIFLQPIEATRPASHSFGSSTRHPF